MALIGGQGVMGTMFRTAFEQQGLTVLVSDKDTTPASREIAAQADVVIVCVPIRATEAVIQEVGPVIRPDALFTDFTSVKLNPVRQMLAHSTGCDVIGGHPLYGPLTTMDHQNFILCPARGDRYLAWYRELLTALGLQVLDMTPETHDRQMGVIQCLIHLSNLSLANTLRRLNFDITHGESIASPIYQLRMHIIGRILAQDPKLYTDIEFENPFSKDMAREYIASAQELEELIVHGKKDAFEAMFRQVSDYFGLEAGHSLRVTNQIIDLMGEAGDSLNLKRSE